MSVASAVSLVALVGCGGGSSNNQAIPTSPYGQINNGQVTQSYSCQAGGIQLRNAFGQAQCFATTDLATACNQIGGMLTSNSLCRKERQIQGYARGSFRNNGAMAPDNMPITLNLFPGEVAKVYGTVDSLTSVPAQWNAQLIQFQPGVGYGGGTVVGSSSGDTTRVSDLANLSIVSTSTYSQGYAQYGQNGVYNQYANQYGNQYLPTQYPNQYGSVWNTGFYNQPQMAVSTRFVLQLMFEGKIRVRVQASAISCEDGHGNSYPCQ
ncbi:MAG: hypothetical protein JST04_11260 [Bdellovibrionales bacterium]|nr:hypothetical protein [Bdellovibrionales bacterium]